MRPGGGVLALNGAADVINFLVEKKEAFGAECRGKFQRYANDCRFWIIIRTIIKITFYSIGKTSDVIFKKGCLLGEMYLSDWLLPSGAVLYYIMLS